MTKSVNCSVPVPCEQKKLLKVLTCLYEQYVINQTPSTDAYFANPTSAGYDAMSQELNAINTLVNGYLDANLIFVDASGTNVAQVDLWASVAQGNLHFNSQLQDAQNTLSNALQNNIFVNEVIYNTGVLKTVQKLNNDECATKAYQVTTDIDSTQDPLTGISTISKVNTQASLVERIGCPGVSNLGFLGIFIQVPIADAPFNKCYTPNC